MKEIEVWHFTANPGVLRDGTPFALGAPLPHIAELVMCKSGYHGSLMLRDAIKYAQGPHLYRRLLKGTVLESDNKLCASDAVAMAYRDATPLLRLDARQSALDVVHLWDATQVVLDWLRTGDESLRQSAVSDAAAAAADAFSSDAAAAAYVAASAWADADAAWAAADADWAAVRAAAAADAKGYAYDNARRSWRLERWATAWWDTGVLPSIEEPQ